MRTSRPTATAAAAVTLALVLAGCAESTEETADPGAAPPTAAEEVDSAHNEADVAFAAGMIPHHRQAVQMSELAAERTDDPDVLALSEEISAAQEPEIETLTSLLEAWGAGVPDAGMDMSDEMGTSHGMDMSDGMGGMAGMMTPEQMADLEAAEGADFDRMFLEMMIAHHEGAVKMAQTQLHAGADPDALQLAEDIISAQQSEVQQMQDLRGTP